MSVVGLFSDDRVRGLHVQVPFTASVTPSHIYKIATTCNILTLSGHQPNGNHPKTIEFNSENTMRILILLLGGVAVAASSSSSIKSDKDIKEKDNTLKDLTPSKNDYYPLGGDGAMNFVNPFFVGFGARFHTKQPFGAFGQSFPAYHIPQMPYPCKFIYISGSYSFIILL